MPIDPSKPSTNTNGSPAPSDEYSLTVGADGPVVLHDAHLVDTLAHFNRENIPERKPHAKGSGAFGHLEVTADVSEYTKASFLQKGRETPMLARFSTVAGELGSPDTWRDVRGFSLKFYTDEGNFDMVGNNTPVFFMRDPMKFPHFIRSQKRLPNSGLRSPNMMYDYWSLSPESAHQVAYLMGPRGIPLSYRTMNGYSSHTYSWVNAEGKITWVKYHFISDQGVHNMTADRAKAIVVITQISTARTSSTTLPTATIRPGPSRCSSCPMTRPRATGSTRSTSPRCGRIRITRCTPSASSLWSATRRTSSPDRASGLLPVEHR
ncbi:catalase [Cutibacterium acnes JCM 18909]|nr:catalase [Cutibacterium acnes JCM 18909]